ncbi:MAG: asparagine--tRNA ligase [Bdellovibrionales bacterium]|nr:asparagine--tRNA ligase [Bdellovibrionales bacterium]
MQKIKCDLINLDKYPVGEYLIEGWVRTHRKSKNVSFIELNDGSTIKGLQLVLDPELESYKPIAEKITTGASISASGKLVESPARGQKYEFQVSGINLIGESDAETYPLKKKGHTLEYLREILHLRPRSNTIGAVMRVRSEASMAVHNFFHQRGFYHLHTPAITTSDCEGGGELFRVTTLDINNPPKTEGKIDFTQDFFKEEAFLTVSGQLEAEIYATSLNKVYTFGPTFRAENSNTVRHLSEFWMIEPEMAFYELADNINLAEEFIKYLINAVLEKCPEEMEFFQQREWTKDDHLELLNKVASSSFEVLDYTDAISILENSKENFEFPVRWGIDLQAEHEKFLCEKHIQGPVVVINYPSEIKAFYMRLNDDQKTVRAMDVLVPRLGEIIGGSQREERHDVLLEKIRKMNLPEEHYWWYLELRKFGTVPHAGFGLGFERFLMYVTGMQNIRDVIPFPRHPGYAKF